MDTAFTRIGLLATFDSPISGWLTQLINRSLCESWVPSQWKLAIIKLETHSSASGLRLRSTDNCDLLVRRMKTRFGDRAFSAAGPRCWNKLPAALRVADSIDSFKTGLKTYLFSKAYSAVS